MRVTQRHVVLPIGRAARLAFEIDALRGGCSQAAGAIVRRKTLDEAELEECARLDDALAEAHRILRNAVRNLMLSRLNRRIRKSRAR